MKPTVAEHSFERFQKDRIALFSDAVFAIAITLLIIEVRVPEHEDAVTDADLWHDLLHLMPKFIGFIISFFVIGQYWLAHHRIFRYVERSSHTLLWNNLLFLLPIVIMPFSTAFLSEFFDGRLRLPLAVYTGTICLTGALSYRLWRVVAEPANHLGRPIHKVVLAYNSARALVAPGIFVGLFLLSFISNGAAYVMLPFMLLSGWTIRRYFNRKHPALMKEHLG